MIDRPKIKVFPGGGENAEEFYWHLIGRNGEIESQGEGYTRRADAVRGIFTMAETVLTLAGVFVQPTSGQVRKELAESIEIIDADGDVLTLEEAGYDVDQMTDDAADRTAD